LFRILSECRVGENPFPSLEQSGDERGFGGPEVEVGRQAARGTNARGPVGVDGGIASGLGSGIGGGRVRAPRRAGCCGAVGAGAGTEMSRNQ
jgi:hypothetical protein